MNTTRNAITADMLGWGYSKDTVIETLTALACDGIVAVYPDNGWSYTYELDRSTDIITIVRERD